MEEMDSLYINYYEACTVLLKSGLRIQITGDYPADNTIHSFFRRHAEKCAAAHPFLVRENHSGLPWPHRFTGKGRVLLADGFKGGGMICF